MGLIAGQGTPVSGSLLTAPAADDDLEQLENLDLGDAVELGAPLTTQQVLLLLAAIPGGDRVTRAGIEARKLG
jgi:hypothetical protein